MRAIKYYPTIRIENALYLVLFKAHLIPIILLIFGLKLYNAYVWKCDQLDYMTRQYVATQALTAQVFGKKEAPEFIALPVKVTMYNPTRAQGWGDGTRTADGNYAAPGVIAISRDLQHRYRLRMGSKVMLGKYGVFTVADLMHPRKTKQVDIISFIPQVAKNFGVRKDTLYIPI